MTCHPEEELILTGSNLGKIRAWRNIRGKGYPINVIIIHNLMIFFIKLTKIKFK